MILSKANTDYTVKALENNLKLEKFYLESMMDIMSMEAEYIQGCMEMGQIVTEALDSTEVEVTKKRGIFQRILDAIEALFGTFKEKITVLMDKNAQWLKANLVNVTPQAVSKIEEIEAVPYWERDANQMGNSLVNVTTSIINRTKQNPEKFSSMESLTELVRQKIGGKDDLASDAKHFFRTGKPGVAAEPVKISGESLSGYLDEMMAYVVQYDKIVAPRLNKFMNSMKSTVKALEADSKTENFCFLENAMYNDTELGLLPNFSVVMEEAKDTKDNQMQNGKINDNQKGEQLNPTKVTVSDGKSDEDKAKEKENSAKVTEYCKNLTNILKILQGAALTVLEEKYITYINIFKVVVQNNKDEDDNKDGSKDDTNKKTEDKQQEPEQEEQVQKKKEKKGLFGRKKNK